MKPVDMKRRLSSSALALSVALPLAVSAPAAFAAEPTAGDEVQEVIVTAEYRRVNQQKVPVAVTVVNAEALELKALENLRDVTTRIPGLFISPSNLTHSTGSYYIRGIGETDSIANQTVGTYVDDVYISRPIGGTFELNDVEDIQVLRGPQGTLYGRNSSAGAVKVTTRTPGNDFRSFLEIGGGNYNASIVRLGLSGPIIKDKLAGSISYIHRKRDGFVYNITHNQTVGDLSTDTLRLKLNYTPNERLELLFTGEYFKDNSDPTPKQPRALNNPDLSSQEQLIWNETELGGVSLRASYRLNETTTLRSITSVRAFTQPGQYDQDGSAYEINKTYSDHRNENWAQEFQYLYEGEKLHAVAGVFFLYDNFRSFRTNYSPNNSNALLTDRGRFLGPRTALQDSGEKTRNGSVYGQLTYDFRPNLHFILGGRYTVEEHNFKFTGNERVGGQYIDDEYTIYRDYKRWESFTPKFGVAWEPADTVSTYLTWSKGFKAGGFDGRANSKEAAGLPYDPEEVVTIELGVKADWFSRRLRTNLAVFDNEIDGYQATALDEFNISHRINLGKVETRGFELETLWRPVHGLSIVNTVSYLESEVITAGGAASNTATFVGKEVQNAPKWLHFASVDYVLPVHAFGQYQVGAEYFYRTKIYADGANTESAAGEAQRIVNLSASFVPAAAQNWRLSLTVRNVGDERYDTGGTRGNGITSSNATTYSDPRTWFVRARYSY